MSERQIHDVIDEVLKVIPEGESVIVDLDKLKHNASYSAPEEMGFCWRDFSLIIGDHLGEPDVLWKKKVKAILADKPLDLKALELEEGE